METQIEIVQFLFKDPWRILSESLGSVPALPFQQIGSTPELLKFCSNNPCCLLFVSIASKDDLIQLATFVKASRKTLKGSVFKVVVLNATNNLQFEKAIHKLGSVEILEPNITVKALRFKIDFWMKAMRAHAKKVSDLIKRSQENSQQDSSTDASGVEKISPLECESDIWILDRVKDCKKVLNRWMIKLMGPSPFVGQWSEAPDRSGLWMFELKPPFDEQFVTGEGRWYFRGEQKPEFNWQENRWFLTGEAFELYYDDEKTTLVRVRLEKGVLTLADNSVYAKTKESLIQESFDKDVVFKTEAQHFRDQTLEFESEGDLGGHLEGEISEASASIDTFLRGKIGTSCEEDKESDPFEGKIDHLDSYWGGKGKSDSLSDHQLSAPAGDENRDEYAGKGSTDKLSTHYRNAEKSQNTTLKKDVLVWNDSRERITKNVERRKNESSSNVLPFTRTEEKELEKLTESGSMLSFIHQNNTKYECQFEDYFDNNIIFISSADGLRNSEIAGVEVELNYRGERVRVSCEGIVRSIDQDGTGGFYVTIELKTEDTAQLERLMSLMRVRQESIDSFLLKAKGY